MSGTMSYEQGVRELREEIANRETFIISGAVGDMLSAIGQLEDRHYTVWMHGDFSEFGVFKFDSSEIGEDTGVYDVIGLITKISRMELGIVVSVPKVDGLPDVFPMVPGKDLISLNNNMPVMVAEAMRVLWPDGTVLAPEETVERLKKKVSLENQS